MDDSRILEAPVCWRRGDVLSVWKGPDEDSKKRLAKYRPFNAPFLGEHGIRLPSSADSASKRIQHWQWSLPMKDAHMTASKYLREVLDLFSLISFGEWVQEALELSPAVVQSFRGKIRSLSRIVFSYLRLRPEAGPRYLEAIIDPFTGAAIQNACNCIRDGQYSESNLVLDFQFIAEPLKNLLYRPLSIQHILQQLDVLEIRFKNWYHSTEVWPGRFDIETPFLKSLSHRSPISLATQMANEDHLQFQELDRCCSKASDNNKCLSPIISRWNSRCRAVQECTTAGDKITSKLVKLVKVLNNMRNYYSMTAVLQGLTLGCFYSLELDGLYKLMNPGNNYQQYRDIMMIDGISALHFPFPAEKDKSYGDSSGLALMLDASKGYWGLRTFFASFFSISN